MRINDDHRRQPKWFLTQSVCHISHSQTHTHIHIHAHTHTHKHSTTKGRNCNEIMSCLESRLPVGADKGTDEGAEGAAVGRGQPTWLVGLGAYQKAI